MADGSAIFIKNGRISTTGSVHYADKGEIKALTRDIIDSAEQQEFRKVFDTIPDQFDRYRNRYSNELFNYLIDYAGIGPGAKVLELGPGTGQASEPVINTGCEYHAIELGEHLYLKMVEKYGEHPNFHIVNDDFVTHDFGDAKFDLIYSAATIQWIPEEAAFGKTLSLLKPGGVLAMMLTSSEYRSNNEALYQKIQKLYDTYYQPDIPYTHGGFRYTAAPEYGYTEVERREFHGKREFSAAEYVAYSGTHCDHIMIKDAIRETFFKGLHDAVEEAGGKIIFNDTYILYLTRKPAGP
ncbi:MAG: methyltransferase domain-containing protein [Lachnospiraceae bacterium]|nr:methyltransferase domain-containing protein [Lachnospiraceae bacterium]